MDTTRRNRCKCVRRFRFLCETCNHGLIVVNLFCYVSSHFNRQTSCQTKAQRSSLEVTGSVPHRLCQLPRIHSLMRKRPKLTRIARLECSHFAVRCHQVIGEMPAQRLPYEGAYLLAYSSYPKHEGWSTSRGYLKQHVE